MTRPLPTEELDEPVVLGDRYELVELLGRGGMAEVHRAHDRMLGRTVAVKLVAPERRGDGTDARRLQDEARAAAALNHPNAVAVYDVGSSPHGVFVVMEHLDGRTWRDELRERGRLPEGDVAAAAAAVADALAAAHERGIVHRDVNPANVMIGPNGVAKLMDFGIARAAAVGRRTATGVVIGTAAYMSPEQVRDETLDGRSDVYSLGCTLYELVTGRTPFGGRSTVEIASARLRESPTPPRRVAREVSREMEEVVLRALALEPAARPDAAALAASLRDLAPTAGAAAPSGRPAPGADDTTDRVTASGGTTDATTATTAATEGAAADDTADPAEERAPSAEDPDPSRGLKRLGRLLVGAGALAVVVTVVLLVLLGR